MENKTDIDRIGKVALAELRKNIKIDIVKNDIFNVLNYEYCNVESGYIKSLENQDIRKLIGKLTEVINSNGVPLDTNIPAKDLMVMFVRLEIPQCGVNGIYDDGVVSLCISRMEDMSETKKNRYNYRFSVAFKYLNKKIKTNNLKV